MINLSKNAQIVLEKRYAWEIDKVKETPEEIFKRVAIKVAEAEVEKSKWEEIFYNMLCNLEFLPNTPALINSGKEKGQFAACFVLPIGDSMEEIFETLTNTAMVHKTGGGTGFNFSSLRPTLSKVSTTQGVAGGPVSFINIFNTVSKELKQGGVRVGANMGILNVTHPDIIEFISAKEKEGEFDNFNFSVGITDEFMLALDKGGTITLSHPKDDRIKTIKAKEIWDKLIQSSWKNGEPGIIFIDRINALNPLKGFEIIEATNPCVSGDTKIWTVLGPVQIKYLVGKTVPVLTQDKKGKLYFESMSNIRVTSEKAELLKIRFSNKTFIKITPEHHLYLRNGKKIKAKNLKVGDRISSVYRGRANSCGGDYRLSNGIESPLEHHVNVSYKYGRRPNYPEEHCHHKDRKRFNNDPRNLFIKKGSKHNSDHMKGKNNPMYGVSINNPKNNLYGYDTSGKNNGRYRPDITKREIKSLLKEGLKLNDIAKKLECSYYTIQCRLGYKRPTNHNIVSITKIKGYHTVYNGSVKNTHKYFIMCGENDAVLSANCGEQPLPPNGSCILGSINLANMFSIEDFDFVKFGTTIQKAVRFLDNLVTLNTYPLEQIKEVSLNTRRIGLGIMGFADMLIKLKIDYRSEEAVDMADTIGSCLKENAYYASSALFEEKGTDSEILKTLKRRNGAITTIAPTGSLSIIADCSSGIEPNFNMSYDKKAINTTLEVVPFLFKQYKEIHGDKLLPDYFVTTKDVPISQHIKVQATFQKYIDNAISKTINAPNSTTKEEVDKAFLFAYESGCKGVTFYREGSRKYEALSSHKNTGRPTKVKGFTEEVKTGLGSAYITINSVNDYPIEVFINIGKAGNDVQAHAECIGRLLSLIFKSKVIPVNKIVEQIKGIGGTSSIWQGGSQIKSIPDAIGKFLEREFLTEKVQSSNLLFCPECNSGIVTEENCPKCIVCGWKSC